MALKGKAIINPCETLQLDANDSEMNVTVEIAMAVDKLHTHTRCEAKITVFCLDSYCF